MHSPDFTAQNVAKLAELFPNCVTESKDDKGNLKKSIDFDLLKQELSADIVEGPKERYRLDWPGKRDALVTANVPVTKKTLRPRRQESVDFDTTENLFIEGDNLDALKLLQKTYLDKVKMIYIDPPYNTGNDFIYKDKFAESTEEYQQESGQRDEEGIRLVANTDSNGRFHSDWLSMMYPRLKLARHLLKDDGVIFISIDDSEHANLKRMCDEIFGAENFVGDITRKQSSGSKNDTDSNKVVSTTDHILSYSKGNFKFYPQLVKPNKKYNYSDDKGKFDIRALEMQGGGDTLPLRENMGYSIYLNKMTNELQIEFDYDLHSPEVYDEPNKNLIKNGYTCYRPRKRGSEFGIWRWGKETFLKRYYEGEVYFDDERVYLKERATDFIEKYPDSLCMDFLNTRGTNEVKDIFDGQRLFVFPKPVNLVKYLLKSATKDDDIILDFFAGSATTAHAVMQLNTEDGGKRKFIMVQLPEECGEKSEALKAGYETIAEISKERIRRAGEKIKGENAEATANLDIGFRVLKVDTSNMVDVEGTPDAIEQRQLQNLTENIKPERTPEDLLFQVLLNWGVDITLPITTETVKGFEVFFVDKDALATCFASDGKITEDLCKELATHKPLRVVFRDSGFENDSVKVNVEQIFKLLSPDTGVRTI